MKAKNEIGNKDFNTAVQGKEEEEQRGEGRKVGGGGGLGKDELTGV